MLYIGNFNYDDANDPAENYCLMPVVVSASNPEEALSKIADLFQHLRKTSDLLDGATEIYLDSLVELEGNPQDAVLTQWSKVVPSADGLSLMSSVLPAAEGDEDDTIEAYRWFGSEDKASDGDDEDDFEDEDPFLILE
ncbi:conserved hypothetical protein [Olsenella uli DSM 7084]|uniref:Uncharacterized protein n=1 Tax=Olsenella uli (strain ATCC 49627 / DSM 7084 / CCUG 31166 / CIP 109912 / JCM 12494 / LMG 11480 / NCIMB 702895 / VPI D76D-27C) TaxID=633147 RepID=E1QZB2_OLSUV|nr:hypothetical protein [Olsenella uli]ADK67726.1 conserved hypothetical protein [Olsenella uli DSM 7084]EUB30419.1 hypothetical protein HMPREF1503_0707 [Olsenella uli MSTE5]KRO13485.1 hypothetical protein IV77_GL000941 [Olsenella uli DSM 7084]MBS6417326.1 hypothetical protein [Olsenella uli]